MNRQPKTFSLEGRRYRLSPRLPAKMIELYATALSPAATREQVEDEVEIKIAAYAPWRAEPGLVEQAKLYAWAMHERQHATAKRKQEPYGWTEVGKQP